MNKIKIFLASILLIAGTMAALAETYRVDVGQFEKLKVNGNISVIYKNLPDSTGFARYDAAPGNDNIFVFATKNDGSLKVEPADEKWGDNTLPVVYLYSDFLSSVESFSDKQVEIINIAPCASLNVNQVGNGTISIENIKSNNVTASITTGNGQIYLSGTCVNANFRMVGAGLISADRLRAEDVKCRILGTGSIGCWPIENLKVTGLGSTKIYYKGSPNIKKTGGGKLFELPDEVDEDVYAKLGTPVQSFDNPPAGEEDDEDDYVEVYEGDDDDYQTIVTADD